MAGGKETITPVSLETEGLQPGRTLLRLQREARRLAVSFFGAWRRRIADLSLVALGFVGSDLWLGFLCHWWDYGPACPYYQGAGKWFGLLP
jgi:hypothetical protein